MKGTIVGRYRRTNKGSEGQDIYSVTLIENGQARTEWMNQDGTAADEHFRKEKTIHVEPEGSNMNQ